MFLHFLSIYTTPLKHLIPTPLEDTFGKIESEDLSLFKIEDLAIEFLDLALNLPIFDNPIHSVALKSFERSKQINYKTFTDIIIALINKSKLPPRAGILFYEWLLNFAEQVYYPVYVVARIEKDMDPIELRRCSFYNLIVNFQDALNAEYTGLVDYLPAVELNVDKAINLLIDYQKCLYKFDHEDFSVDLHIDLFDPKISQITYEDLSHEIPVFNSHLISNDLSVEIPTSGISANQLSLIIVSPVILVWSYKLIVYLYKKFTKPRVKDETPEV